MSYMIDPIPYRFAHFGEQKKKEKKVGVGPHPFAFMHVPAYASNVPSHFVYINPCLLQVFTAAPAFFCPTWTTSPTRVKDNSVETA